MGKNCLKCDFGVENFWSHTECFKFITNIDTSTTFFTAEREKDATRLNGGGNCSWYKRTPWYKKIVRSI